jgi:hypothetical protein
MGALVAAGRKIVVGSVLILVRASLIAFTSGLVVVRPRLILITHRLVVIRQRLILVTPTRHEFAAAGRTTGNLGHLAAGWTPHNLRHPMSSLQGSSGGIVPDDRYL